jgi:hypothetical protein
LRESLGGLWPLRWHRVPASNRLAPRDETWTMMGIAKWCHFVPPGSLPSFMAF